MKEVHAARNNVNNIHGKHIKSAIFSKTRDRRKSAVETKQVPPSEDPMTIFQSAKCALSFMKRLENEQGNRVMRRGLLGITKIKVG